MIDYTDANQSRQQLKFDSPKHGLDEQKGVERLGLNLSRSLRLPYLVFDRIDSL
jgi:hypothetical protein